MTTLFHAAFPESAPPSPVTPQSIVEALSAYERTLVSPVTRFDRYVAGASDALSEVEKQGFALFVGRAGCVACHGGWRFTDDRLHDIGLPELPTANGTSTYFKTPSLRELTHTAPYMHDGSKATLEDVIAHYDGGFERRPELSPNIVRNLNLSDGERLALVAFLKSLSTERNEELGKARTNHSSFTHSEAPEAKASGASSAALGREAYFGHEYSDRPAPLKYPGFSSSAGVTSSP